MRQEVFNDLSNADQFVSVMVKNGILKEWKIDYDRNDHCIGEDYDVSYKQMLVDAIYYMNCVLSFLLCNI